MYNPTFVHHCFSFKKQRNHPSLKINTRYPTEKISTCYFSDGKTDRQTYIQTRYIMYLFTGGPSQGFGFRRRRKWQGVICKLLCSKSGDMGLDLLTFNFRYVYAFEIVQYLEERKVQCSLHFKYLFTCQVLIIMYFLQFKLQRKNKSHEKLTF